MTPNPLLRRSGSAYATIVADPPWRYTQKPTERTGAGVSAEHVYSTMTTEEIAVIEIESAVSPLARWVRATSMARS